MACSWSSLYFAVAPQLAQMTSSLGFGLPGILNLSLPHVAQRMLKWSFVTLCSPIVLVIVGGVLSRASEYTRSLATSKGADSVPDIKVSDTALCLGLAAATKSSVVSRLRHPT